MSRLTRALTRRAGLLLAGLLLFLYLPGLVGGQVLHYRDNLSHHLGWRTLWAEQVRAGQLPLWDSLTLGGSPLLADPNTLSLYPSTALFLVLPAPVALTAHYALHHLLLAFGGFVLLRRLGHCRATSTLGATFLAGGGLAFSQLVFTNSAAALAWAPWLMWAAVRLPSSGPARWRRLAFAALFGALALLAGEPIVAAFGWSLWLLCLLIEPSPGPGRFRRLAGALLAPICSLLLAAPLLLPSIEIWSDSSRHLLGNSPASFAADSFAPRRWPEILLPHLHGAPGPGLPDGFWARPSFGWLRYEIDLHVGSLALVLIGLGASGRRRWWLAAAAAATAAAATPGAWALLAELVPGMSGFRYSVKLLLLAHLALVPLVASGAAAARRRPRALRRRAVALAALLLATGLVLGTPAGSRHVLGALYPASASNLELPGVAESVAASVRRDVATGILPLAAVAVSQRLLLPALAVQMVAGGVSMLMWDDWSRYSEPPPLARRLAVDGRLVDHVRLPVDELRPFPEAAPSPQAYGRLAHRSLWRFSGTLHGIGYRGARGPDGLEPWRLADCAARLAGAGDPVAARAARHLGAAWILRSSPLPPAPELVSVESVEIGGATVHLHRLAEPAPGCWLAETLISEPWRDGAWARLCDSRLRPGRDAVTVAARAGRVEYRGGELDLVEARPGHWRLHVETPAGGLIVLDQTWSPLWGATIDGLPAETLEVNLWQLAVSVPAGAHEVEVRIGSASATRGFALALAALIAALWLVIRSSRARRLPTDEPAPTSPATPPPRSR